MVDEEKNLQGDSLHEKSSRSPSRIPNQVRSSSEKRGHETAFGAELYRLRTIAGMLQGAVAQTAGLSRAYYGQVENSRRYPPPRRTVVRIAEAMRLTHMQCDELQRMADMERCRVIHIPAGLPLASAQILRTLVSAIHSLSEDQVRQISQIMKGGSSS